MGRLVAALLVTLTALSCSAQESYGPARSQMLEDIRHSGPPRVSERILSAMGRVERHRFVPDEYQRSAYANRPLPIGEGQTISQPYIVALMTDLAAVDSNSIVLEVGTGSGYQAAVLAELVNHVYTIEIVDTLAQRATRALERLGYDNVSVRSGDGYAGWPAHAPFDAIIVTAAPETVPEPLIEQLKPGGRLVIPVGAVNRTQVLKVISKDKDGAVSSRDVTLVRFVPFTRDDSE